MTVFRLYNASMKDQLEKYHKEDHAKRYGTDANYKKSSFNLGWRIQPSTDLKGRKEYKWGTYKDLHPPNLANPFTKKVPALIDFLQTKEPRYLFYTLEDWDISNDEELIVEAELICRALLYWRLMLFSGNLDIDSKHKIKFFLKTTQEIIKDIITQDHIAHLVKLNSQKKEISVTMVD